MNTADICDSAEITRIFEQYQPGRGDAFGCGKSCGPVRLPGQQHLFETNIVGTYALLEVARKYWSALGEDKKNNFRFHHISTDEVYGRFTAS
ncbi:dTDP-glucose 4,6-dehydratase [Salmonella enterica subsp. enterica]|uniref:dTDP-glucose 4,6-dehydratase n=1 Tax=Salmonella enterica I TaxID=59201 RepID=A0A3S4HYV9_SALET|nr:dTDP-glucose 4,6-dehydratase [Salmonella enterica subsp. enterica]